MAGYEDAVRRRLMQIMFNNRSESEPPAELPEPGNLGPFQPSGVGSGVEEIWGIPEGTYPVGAVAGGGVHRPAPSGGMGPTAPFPPVPRPPSGSNNSDIGMDRRLLELLERRNAANGDDEFGEFLPDEEPTNLRRYIPDEVTEDSWASGGYSGGFHGPTLGMPGYGEREIGTGPIIGVVPDQGSNNSTIVEDILGGLIGGGFTPAPGGIGAQVQSQIDPRLETILRRMLRIQ